jgi:hypothetical protein
MSTLDFAKLPSDTPQVSQSLGLTEESTSWLIAATDPFHDVAYKLHGYPDLCADNSYVIAQKTTVQVSAPAAVTWDCHIFALNQLYVEKMWPCVDQPDSVCTTDDSKIAAGVDVGHLNIVRVLTGQNTTPNVSTWNPTNLVQSTLPTDNGGMSDGSVRLLGAGFEAVNVSAPIYAQGSVIVYRQGDFVNHGMQTGETEAAVTIMSNAPVKVTHRPPSTASEAMKIPNARQWEAKKGAYCVQLMNNEHNPFSYACKSVQIRKQGFNASNAGAGYADYYGPSFQQFVPFSQVGAYFTNLAPDSVLKVTFVRYLEISPGAYSSNVSLSSASSTYSEKALQIYGNMISILPPGTYVSDNATGDWFRGIVKLAKESLPYITKGIDLITGTKLGTGAANFAAQVANKVRSAFTTPAPQNNGLTNTNSATFVRKRGQRARRGRGRMGGNANRNANRNNNKSKG